MYVYRIGVFLKYIYVRSVAVELESIVEVNVVEIRSESNPGKTKAAWKRSGLRGDVSAWASSLYKGVRVKSRSRCGRVMKK